MSPPVPLPDFDGVRALMLLIDYEENLLFAPMLFDDRLQNSFTRNA